MGRHHIPDWMNVAANLDKWEAEQKAASALPPAEPQGGCERSRLATCSLPVSSGDLLRIADGLDSQAKAWANIVAGWKDGPSVPAWRQRIASTRHAANLLRAEAERLTERQPEENV